MASTRNSSRSADLVARASDCLGQFVRHGDRLAVALSGGVDSVCLLHVLRKLSGKHGFHLSALHVNHGISSNADGWQAFCERLCETWGIPLVVKRVSVERNRGEGLEAAARRARYRAFAEVEGEWLALAHHRDDQAETLLLNLMRGTGVCGAAAMPKVRSFSGRPGPKILRPLLDTSRKEMEAFARSKCLAWIEDESNADVSHSRNFLRHRVFPQLRERFPGCDAALARAAAHFSESDRLLEDLARIDAGLVMDENRIIVSQLAKMDTARASNLLRYVLRREGIVPPDSACLHEIVRQVCHAAPDRQVSFDLGSRVLHRYRGQIWLIPHGEAGPEMEWKGDDVLAWGSALLRFETTTGTGISRDKLARGQARISPRHGGEHFRPDGRRPRRELKKLLQELAVPPWERDRLPLLWCDDALVWVPGVGIDSAWQCSPGESALQPFYEQRLEVA